jgi:hypothetical protein
MLFDTVFILINRSEESLEEYTWESFWVDADALYEDTLTFTFKCRAEGWLRAEGYIRKRRRQRGEPELEELEVEPPPKPEPMEEVIHVNEVPTDGAKVISTAGSPPQPRSPTPLIYGNEEPAAQPGMATHSALQLARQEQTHTEPRFVTLKRPQKIPRHSGNFTFTVDGENRSVIIEAHSVHQPPAEVPGSGSKVKVEEVKMEEGGSVPKVKEELKVCHSNSDTVPSVDLCSRRKKQDWNSK